MKRVQKGRVGQALLWMVSLLVALSMVCGTVLIVLPHPQRRSRPTMLPVQSATASVLATPGLPTATPTAALAIAPSPLPQPTP